MNVCICGGDVARLRPIHVTHVNESSHTHHRVMPHISMSHVARGKGGGASCWEAVALL